MTAFDAQSTYVPVSFPNRNGGNVTINIDHSRDALLTDFGRATLADRYLLEGETPQLMFGRVSGWFAKSEDHAQTVYDAMSRLWFMPATPVLSNGGTDRGLPISCFLNAVPDSLQGIHDVWSENIGLASNGGGIGTYWGGVRSIGEPIKDKGKTSGIIPFIKVMDSLTLAISQGSLRRGSAAVYLDVHHPEIEEFIDIRRPTGDANRRSLNLHHGVMIDDKFMAAVTANGDYDLISPLDGSVQKTIKARQLFIKMVTARLEVGEPYMVFSDTINAKVPALYRILGLKVKQSNLCSEIALHTGMDYHGNDRTAVCCLASLNMETLDQWYGSRSVMKAILYFIDEVMSDFIKRGAEIPGFEKAVYAAGMERSIGLGVMGFHSYLQSKGVAFDSEAADQLNRDFFGWFKRTGDGINHEAAEELGECPDSFHAGQLDPDFTSVRWAHWSSIAPTASISIIAANASPCTEPWPGNAFTQKTRSGSFLVKNRYLEPFIQKEAAVRFAEGGGDKEQWMQDQWDSIIENKGSVAHLDFLTDDTKTVFATAFELDQMAVIRQAADRASSICQMASVNISVPADIAKGELIKIHRKAHELGVPSLYYTRSISVARATNIAGEMPTATPPHEVILKDRGPVADVLPEACGACQ